MSSRWPDENFRADFAIDPKHEVMFVTITTIRNQKFIFTVSSFNSAFKNFLTLILLKLKVIILCHPCSLNGLYTVG